MVTDYRYDAEARVLTLSLQGDDGADFETTRENMVPIELDGATYYVRVHEEYLGHIPALTSEQADPFTTAKAAFLLRLLKSRKSFLRVSPSGELADERTPGARLDFLRALQQLEKAFAVRAEKHIVATEAQEYL
ncbi:hypothetical protein GYA13_01220 [Candidatus Kuenenbacteria bacterium]|nr:hypothetical protein [Candidatus Kuenenbacteria bacterium]